MKRTSLGALIGVGIFMAAAAAILTTRFYGLCHAMAHGGGVPGAYLEGG